MHEEGPPPGGPSRYKRRVRRLVPLVAASLLAVGCGGHGDDSGRVEVSVLPKLVLQPSDVPRLGRFDVGRITRFDAPEGPRANPRRFGRLDGWKADYKTSGGTTALGALVVHSQVDLFGGSDGAGRDLDAYADQFRSAREESPRTTRLFEPAIGERAAALALTQPGTPPLHVFTVAWADGRVTASVTVNGFKGLTEADVLRLARRQERRIAAAESGSS